MAKLIHTLIKTNNTHNSSIRSDEGLTLETSAFQIFRGGNPTIINSWWNQMFMFHSPTYAPSRFLYKLEFSLKSHGTWDTLG